jgi:hypothetical protein
MKNLLRLHEAIAVVLLKQPNRTATFERIAFEIEKRGLFLIRKGNIPLSKQVELRAIQSQGRYKHLFEKVGSEAIKLR